MSKRKLRRFKEDYIIPILLVFISIIIVLLSKGNLFGFIIIVSGLLTGWYASLGKWYNYIYGIIFSACNAYVSFVAGLYGIAILSVILYIPIQIHGLMDWYSKKNKNNEVRIRSFTLKNSILITILCFFGSISFGLILTKIPGQQLAFLDATSNVINICGTCLMNMRFRECWWIFLGNNLADLIIWILNFINNVPNSLVMLIVSVGYLILNFIGLIKWERIKNKRRY